MTKTRIGVVRGGPSNEYEISLRTGSAVLDALDRDKYEPVDIFISKGGAWHVNGVEVQPHEALRRTDAVFNALHGEYGEDGKIQQLLEAHGHPFTGSGAFSSSVAMAKHLAKEAFLHAGLRAPKHVIVQEGCDPNDAYAQAFRKFPLPFIVKPAKGGSSVGASLVRKREDLEEALSKAFEHGAVVLVEEFIPGTEATVGVIQGFRGQSLYALPPVEIRPKGKGFFDYEAKYAGGSDEIVPATFSAALKADLEAAARKAHEALGLRHYSRSDFIVSSSGRIYILETNSLPGLTSESLVPKALAAVGSSTRELAEHIIRLALD